MGPKSVKCQIMYAMLKDCVSLFSGKGWKVGVGVTFGLVGLVIIVLGSFFLLKKYKPK